jgi:hypothetical protein
MRLPDAPGAIAMTGRRPTVAAALALAAIVALFFAHAFLYRRYISDDAYVTLRYARNLCSGHGPYFNP